MTHTLTAEQLGELEAMLALASPTPVTFLENQSVRGHHSVVFPDGDAEIGTWWVAGFEHKDDGRLFAVIRNAAPALIAMARRAEAAETEAKGLRIQVETMARIGAAREKQFAGAKEERDALRAQVGLAALEFTAEEERIARIICRTINGENSEDWNTHAHTPAVAASGQTVVFGPLKPLWQHFVGAAQGVIASGGETP